MSAFQKGFDNRQDALTAANTALANDAPNILKQVQIMPQPTLPDPERTAHVKAKLRSLLDEFAPQTVITPDSD